MKPEDGRRVRDNMGKTKYHVACMFQTPELNLRALFEEYHAQVGG
jgi:hypothetical protein